MMTNLPMPGEAQSPANYMKQARLKCACTHMHARIVPCACACAHEVDHAECMCVCVWPCRWTRWSTRCRCACSSWARRTPTSSPCTREEALAERRLKCGATCVARPRLRLRLRPRQLSTGWLLYHCLPLPKSPRGQFIYSFLVLDSSFIVPCAVISRVRFDTHSHTHNITFASTARGVPSFLPLSRTAARQLDHGGSRVRRTTRRPLAEQAFSF